MNRLVRMILLYQQGEQDAAPLVERFAPLLLHYARLLPLEDGFEELRLCLLETLGVLPAAEFPEESADWAALSYIKKAVYHRYIALSKKSQLEQRHSLPCPALFPCAGEEPEALWLRRLVARLPPRQRLVIRLEFYVGYRETEIAPLLGISRQAVNQLKKRALRNLKEWMTV